MTASYVLSPSAFLYHADCREALRALPDNSIDSVVTDPPYHLTSVVKRFGGPNAAPAKEYHTGVYGGGFDPKGKGTGAAFARMSKGFMNQVWDGGDIAFRPELWAEVFRVLKPGGFVAAFGSSRGYHRMACAIEDAGFDIRDSLMWVYGSGFPKSRDSWRLELQDKAEIALRAQGVTGPIEWK